MALLPPELRQPVAPLASDRPAAVASSRSAGDATASWATDATSFAFAPPEPQPVDAAAGVPPAATTRPLSGLSEFLSEGLRHLDQPVPRASADGPAALPEASSRPEPMPAGPAPTGFAAFLSEGLRHLDAPSPLEPPPPPPIRPAEPRPSPPVPTREPRPAPPAGWSLPANPSLCGAREIAGLVAVCLVDGEEGLLLAAEGRGLDLDAVAAHGTEVVRAERRTIELLGLRDDLEDVLVTTGRRLHVIRPLRALPSCFLYLILDRKAANLGMARFQLDRIEGGLGP